MSDLHKIVGDNIRRLRENRNIEQQELAQRIGISKQQMWRIEAGQQGTPLSRLEVIASILDVKPYDLLKDSNDIECPINLWIDQLPSDVVKWLDENPKAIDMVVLTKEASEHPGSLEVLQGIANLVRQKMDK